MPAATQFFIAVIVVAKNTKGLLCAIDIEDPLGEDMASSARNTHRKAIDELIGTNMYEGPQPVSGPAEYSSERRLSCNAGSSNRRFIEDALVSEQVAQPLELMCITV